MSSPFSAVLLAGGKSTRMGRDKAFLEINGRPLWQRQIEVLAALEPAEIFLAGPRHAAWSAAGCEIVADAQKDAGPLGGLVAGLRRCRTPLLLALAVDLPEMTAEYLGGLVESCTATRGVVPKSSARFEPLAAIYPVTALPLAENFLRAGHHSLQTFVTACLAEKLLTEVETHPDEAHYFRNINTPADFAAHA